MSIHCGTSFGGGQGYTDTCGKEVYGKGTPLAQCSGCMKEEIIQLKAENESLRKDAERYRSMFGNDDSWDYSDRWICESKADVDEMIDAISSPESH